MHMHIISYNCCHFLYVRIIIFGHILIVPNSRVKLKMCFHPHPYFMFICHTFFLSCHRVLHSLSSTAIQRNSSNTSLIDSITLDTLVSNECIPSFNNCTVLSSSPFIPSSPTSFINVASNSELRNRNLSKCNAAVKFNFSHSAFCSCVIAVVISVRWLLLLLFLLSLFNNVDLTELIVSLNTENVAVTLAHNAGYVVIFPDSNMVDRPL